jgi:hypothetical protein
LRKLTIDTYCILALRAFSLASIWRITVYAMQFSETTG